MRKLQQFKVYMFQSSRLSKSNYNISIDIPEARINGEIISMGESQLIRSIFEIKNRQWDSTHLSNLYRKRKKIQFKRNSQGRKDEMFAINNEIDTYLHVPEIISVKFNHTSHYQKCSKNGIKVNGKKYVRLMAGAGHLRRSTVLFCEEEIYPIIIEKFENGFDKSIEINFGKYGAYLGLYASSSLVVSTPRFVVVPDLEIRRMRRVDFVTDDSLNVIEREMEISHNVFDGQGLVSSRMAEIWSNEIELDYHAVQFIFRAPFSKGLLVQFPFHEWAVENGIESITDIYGEQHSLKNIDVILTESQFKMGKYYKSISAYSDMCRQGNLSWGITRVNPNIEKDFFWTSYQYLQVLNKENVDFESLLKPTIDYIDNVSGCDPGKAMVYLMGELTKKDDHLIEDFDDVTKALMLDASSINDPHIRSYILKTLNKKIRESYTGKILVLGNYQFIVYDPVALIQHALGWESKDNAVTGILGDNEHYSQYWNLKDVKHVVSGRSPLTWRSELKRLSFTKNFQTEKWFGHLYSGIVYNIHGVDMMLYGDADGDGDSVFTTSNPEMFSGSLDVSKPITYNRQNAPKEILEYSKFFKYDIASFNSKIGLVTNYSTTYYAMQSLFEPHSTEWEEIEKRLMICRKLQGQEIDKTKGIISAPLPEWDKRIPGDELHNSILVKKRPFWMIYLYSHKKSEWEEHFLNYDYYCMGKWGVGIDSIMKNPDTKEKESVAERFKKHAPVLLGASGTMDTVSELMRANVSEIKLSMKNLSFDPRIYMSSSPRLSTEIKAKLLELLKEYKKLKKDVFLNKQQDEYVDILDYIKGKMYSQISSDLVELTDNAVDLFYIEKGNNHDFVWAIVSDGLLYNLKKGRHSFSFPREVGVSGEFDFMGKEYVIVTKEINEEIL